MKHIALTVLGFIFPLLLLSHGNHEGTPQKIKYIENKNQWLPEIHHSAKVSGASIHLMENKIVFDLYDAEKMGELAQLSHDRKIDATTDMTINGHIYHMNFENANPNPTIQRSGKSEEYYNYFLGDNPNHWGEQAYGFHEITYKELYSRIDLVVHSDMDLMKYDFVVRPEGNPNQIKLSYDGLDRLSVDKDGNLVLETSLGKVFEEKPYAYQVVNGQKKEVACSFQVERNHVQFIFPDGYDETKELVIDPTLMFSTYSGSTTDNFGYTATFDSDGFLYSGSTAFGNQSGGHGYPVTVGAYQTTWGGGVGTGTIVGTDIAISKYDTTGTFMVYSTLIGGAGDEMPHSLVVNQNDELFVYGTTGSSNYPITANAFQTSFGGGSDTPLTGLAVHYNIGCDIIISRLSADGTQLLASTYVGGSQNDGINTDGNTHYNYADEVRGEIIIDGSNNIYVASTTNSANFPVSTDAFQPNFGGGGQDGCVFKMDNNLTTMLWSSFLGGSGADAVYALTLDSNDDLYVCGGTNSTDLPTTPGVLYENFQGGRTDGFITHLNKDGETIISSTYFGSPEYDQTYFVDRDASNNIYVFGQAENAGSYYILNAAYNTPNSGQFISKMSPQLDNLDWSTSFGTAIGAPNISPAAFMVDVCNKIYLSGWGGGTNGFGTNNNAGFTTGMDVTPNAYQSTTDGSDFYLMVLEDDASTLSYGSFFGGNLSQEHVDGGTSRFDRNGRMYQSVCAGCGSNDDFPIHPDPGAHSATNNSTNCNNGVFKFDFDLPITLADFNAPPAICLDDGAIQFENTSTAGQDFEWDFGDGSSTSTEFEPSHEYDETGTYTVTLITHDINTCNLTDTISKEITILDNTGTHADDLLICHGESVQIGVPPSNNPDVSYEWQPTDGLSDPTISNPVASPETTTAYELLINIGTCSDTLYQLIEVIDLQIDLDDDLILCPDASSTITVNGIIQADTIVWSWESDFSDTLNEDLNQNTWTVEYGDTGYLYLTAFNDECTATDSIFIINAPEIELETAGAVIICSTEDSVYIHVENLNPSNDLSYTWSPEEDIIGDNTLDSAFVSPGATQSFSVVAEDQFGCTENASVLVELSTIPVDITTNNDTLICGETNADFFASTNGSATEYIWSLNPDFSDTLNTDLSDSTYTHFVDGDFIIYVHASNNECFAIDSIMIGFVQSATQVQDEYFLCFGDETTLEVINLYPDIEFDHHWEPEEEIISGQGTSTVVVEPIETTTFIVTSTNDQGCDITDSITVWVSDLGMYDEIDAIPDQDTIVAGDGTDIHVDPDGFSYSWTPTEGLDDPTGNPVYASPDETTTYQVVVNDQGICTKSTSVTIYVIDMICGPPDIFVPNAFTPNNDGKNDKVFVRGNNIREMHFAIYNRWGELVFETEDQSIGWDGTYKGELVDPAVFVYHLEATCVGEVNYFEKGNITLIR